MKRENILIAIIFLGLLAHYCLGYVFLDLEAEKIYMITVCFSLDIWGLVLFIITRVNKFKVLGALGMGLATILMYREIGDTSYEQGVATVGLALINLVFSLYYADILKSLKR